jgi:hypothetical protein
MLALNVRGHGPEQGANRQEAMDEVPIDDPLAPERQPAGDVMPGR